MSFNEYPVTITSGGVTSINGQTGAVSITTASSFSELTGTAAVAQGGTGLTAAGIDSTQALMSDGADGFVMATPAGSSPFISPSYIDLPLLGTVTEVVLDPNGIFAYVGGTLAIGFHGAIVKIKISDGSVVTYIDLGASTVPVYLAIDTPGTSLYAVDQNGAIRWWKISTGTMSLIHFRNVVAPFPTGVSSQPFDLSPDGTKYAYVDATSSKFYYIDTSSYTITSRTGGHSSAGHEAISIAFYNGSSTDVYVAYNTVAAIDRYTTAGTYTSSITTSAVSPYFSCMRSGINDTLGVIDNTNFQFLYISSGTPTTYPITNTSLKLTVNKNSGIASTVLKDSYVFITSGAVIQIVDTSIRLISAPDGLRDISLNGIAVSPDSAESRLFISGGTLPSLWAVPLISQISVSRVFATTIDGGGSTISTGIQGADLLIPFACIITSVTLLADTSGSIEIDIWNQSYASYPPTVSQTITASALPTISSDTKSQDTTLAGWTRALAANSTLRFNVNSCSTITKCTIILEVLVT